MAQLIHEQISDMIELCDDSDFRIRPSKPTYEYIISGSSGNYDVWFNLQMTWLTITIRI